MSGQQHVEYMLGQSLKNLGMDYIDSYIRHMWDYNTPLYDIMAKIGLPLFFVTLYSKYRFDTQTFFKAVFYYVPLPSFNKMHKSPPL